MADVEPPQPQPHSEAPTSPSTLPKEHGASDLLSDEPLLVDQSTLPSPPASPSLTKTATPAASKHEQESSGESLMDEQPPAGHENGVDGEVKAVAPPGELESAAAAQAGEGAAVAEEKKEKENTTPEDTPAKTNGAAAPAKSNGVVGGVKKVASGAVGGVKKVLDSKAFGGQYISLILQAISHSIPARISVCDGLLSQRQDMERRPTARGR